MSIMNRWQLRKCAKLCVVAAYICWALAALLERSREHARREAESAVRWHEMNHHPEETDE